MQTIFDWVTMAVFSGLVVLFLNRSMAPEEKQDNIYHYGPPALGCAVANYLGIHDQRLAASALITAVVGYILFFLQPFAKR